MNFFSLYKRFFLYKIKKKINIDLEESYQNKSLEDLFLHYGTDKANLRKNGKEKGHGYAKYYEKHLKSFKKENINILEIGSYSGASASSFAKYFFKSKIFCIDVNISNFKYSSKRIKVYGIDVGNKKMIYNFLKKVKEQDEITKFDLIIDDGSHKLSDILNSLNFFLDKLNDGGYYVIEDFKFPNYFEHLNDINELKIDEIINKLKKDEDFSSNIIELSTKKLLKNLKENIFIYKGNLDESDIVFLKKG